jgi:branched-chain amino acid transport system substrate-binding protein
MKNVGVRTIVAFVLVLALCFTLLTGCGNNATPAGGDTAPDAAGEKTSIKIGFVAPLSGPMANFTIGINHAAELALAAMNADGGIYIKEYDKKLPVEIIWGDSESDSTKASEVATKLVTESKVDILVGEWTPDTINPVSVVGERYQIPTLLANSPDTSWLANGPYEWSFALLFNYDYFIDEYFNGFDRADTNKKIGLVLDSNVDGVGMAEIMASKASERGYEVVDPGRFPQGTTDYSSVISEIKSSGCDIMVASLLTPELVTLWNQCLQLSYQPKLVILSKGMHFSADVKNLGIVNNCIETQWSSEFPFTSSLLGKTAAELSADFEATLNQQADLTLGWDYALFDVIADVLQRAETLDKTALRDAFAATDIECIYGHVTFAENHVGHVPIVFGQWVADETWGVRKALIAAEHVPEVTIREDLLPMAY